MAEGADLKAEVASLKAELHGFQCQHARQVEHALGQHRQKRDKLINHVTINYQKASGDIVGLCTDFWLDTYDRSICRLPQTGADYYTNKDDEWWYDKYCKALDAEREYREFEVWLE